MMPAGRVPAVPMIAAGVVLAALVYKRIAGDKPDNQSWVGYMAEQAGGAAVDAVDGVLSGVAYGVGDRLGVPRTQAEQGRAELAAGDYWNASFHLPAGEFISGSWRRLWE